MATGDYTLIYPTPKVGLPRLTRAALALAGSAYVSVVSGAGSQALRVPADRAEAIYDHAGLTADGEDIHDPPTDAEVAARPPEKTPDPASGPVAESTGPDAPKLTAAPTPKAAPPAATPGRPAGRAGGRTARKAAKKTTPRSTGAPKKEG